MLTNRRLFSLYSFDLAFLMRERPHIVMP